mgnify:CR=1 FL=1
MTGWKTWAALEEVTAANMNSYVRDQTVQVFTNSASRSAAITSPTRGLVSFLTDPGSLEVYYGATTGWAKPWNLPWGNVTESTLASQQFYGAGTWGFPLSWTGTPIANRNYQMTISFTDNPAAAGRVNYGIHSSAGTPSRLYSFYAAGAGYYWTGATTLLFTTTGSSMTRGLAIVQATGTGGTFVEAGATLSLVDLGPSTSTAPAS